MLKLHQAGIHLEIWRLLSHWYSSATTAILWEGISSRRIQIAQGVRQGAILSPILYSIFVDELLDNLTTAGYGIKFNDLFIGAPMYADDLALVADSPVHLLQMLDIVHSYSCKWRYRINPQKSIILVMGETPQSCLRNRQLRTWRKGEF